MVTRVVRTSWKIGGAISVYLLSAVVIYLLLFPVNRVIAREVGNTLLLYLPLSVLACGLLVKLKIIR